jgi:hypothetical protein
LAVLALATTAATTVAGLTGAVIPSDIEGTQIMWNKVKAWFKHSLTILWARIVALVGLLLAAGEQLLQDPSINSAVQSALQPKFIPYYVIAIGLITEIARRRTAGRAWSRPCSAGSAICWAAPSPRRRSTLTAPSSQRRI